MGLGKTVATLTALQQMRDDFDIGNTLVVAPLRVARKTWTDEIEEWAHLKGITTAKIIGTPKQRYAAMNTEADIHLINREMVEWLSFEFMEYRKKHWYWTNKWPWDTVVLDESRSFASQDSNRFKALRRLNKKVSRMIQLTGTPAPNGLQDLWAQAFLLDGGQRLGNTLTAFRQRWMDPPGFDQVKWGLKSHAEKEIQAAMQGIALTMKADDYLELPPVVHNWIRVSLSNKEMDQYRKFQREAITHLKGQKINAVNAGALWGKLMQMANGSCYYAHPAWEEFHDHKLRALAELDEAAGGPMLVAYSYIPDKERILNTVAKKSNRTWRVLKTQKDEDDWLAGRIDRLLMHPASGGHGLNIYGNGAQDICWFGENASLELVLQMNARLAGGHRRAGKNVVIHHITADGTLDDQVRLGLDEKEGLQDRLMDATRRMLDDV
jgi:hypothetical protein